MKWLLFVCLLLMCFCGCKKSNKTLSPIEIEVDGLSDYYGPDQFAGTTILGVDVTQSNTVVLNAVSNGNFIYSTAIVYAGDEVTFTYYLSNTLGINTGKKATLNCFYKGEKIGSTSVLLGDVNKYSFSVSVPQQ